LACRPAHQDHERHRHGQAIDYSLRRWAALTRYLYDPALPFVNNHDEQQI
jgi:hypothetical protein